MHGIWLLTFAPIAAVIAWRYSGPTIRKLAAFALVVTAVVLVGWFGYASVVGSEFTTSLYDRFMHSIGVVFSSTSFPVVQILAALLIVVSWPRRFEFHVTGPNLDVSQQ